MFRYKLSFSTWIRVWKAKLGNFISIWFINEFITLNKLALPNMLAYILSNLNKFVCLVFAGHISSDKKFFDGSSIALSFTNVTGGAISVGLSSALATLCSQAYGAKQYRRCGLYYQKTLLIHALACFPLFALWLNLETILLLIHQDPDVAQVAGQFITYFSISLPALQLSYITLKLFQSHNMILPQILITSCGVLINVIGQYILVIYLQQGIAGCALAYTASLYIVAAGYVLYIRFSYMYQQTWGKWRLDALYDWYQYFRYGIPGMLMICFEWWSFEFGYFTIGAVAPYSEVELGIYSVLMNISALVYSIPLGYMIAATVRTGNLLGQSEPNKARRSSYISLGTIICIGFIQFVVIFCSRHWLSLLYTNDTCILAGSIWPVIIVSILQIIDGYQSVAGGVIKGCGKQKFGAIINSTTYGFISLPLAFIFAFMLKWYTSGFWLGLGVWFFIQASGYTLVLLCANWRETAELAVKNAGVVLQDKHEDKESETKKSLINPGRMEHESLQDEESSCASENTKVKIAHVKNFRTPILDKSRDKEIDSQDESELENDNLLEKHQTVSSHDRMDNYTLRSKLIFTVISRTLTLILCLLFLVLGILFREYHFSVSFYQLNPKNSTYCPYFD